MTEKGPQAREWLRSVALTLAFAALVAMGAADRGAWLPLVVIGVAALGLGALYLLFPRGVHFAFGASAGLAVYACLYVVVGRAAFPEALPWATAPGQLLPIFAFLAVAWARQAELKAVIGAATPFGPGHLRRALHWLLPLWGLGALCMALPVNRLPPFDQSLALLGAMAVVGIMVAASARGVVLLLNDMARIMEEVGRSSARIAVPIFAFLTVYSMLVVVFASLYRVADGLSRVPLFHSPGGPVWIGFPEALYFSLVTQATVGYGDLTPHDDGVRLLAAGQVVLGQLLLLFGVAELIRGARAAPSGATGPEGHRSVEAPGGDGDPRRRAAGD